MLTDSISSLDELIIVFFKQCYPTTQWPRFLTRLFNFCQVVGEPFSIVQPTLSPYAKHRCISTLKCNNFENSYVRLSPLALPFHCQSLTMMIKKTNNFTWEESWRSSQHFVQSWYAYACLIKLSVQNGKNSTTLCKEYTNN